MIVAVAGISSLPPLSANFPLPELSGITQAHNHSKGVFSHPLAQGEDKAHLSLVNMSIRRNFSWTPPTTEYLALFLWYQGCPNYCLRSVG